MLSKPLQQCVLLGIPKAITFFPPHFPHEHKPDLLLERHQHCFVCGQYCNYFLLRTCMYVYAHTTQLNMCTANIPISGAHLRTSSHKAHSCQLQQLYYRSYVSSFLCVRDSYILCCTSSKASLHLRSAGVLHFSAFHSTSMITNLTRAQRARS